MSAIRSIVGAVLIAAMVVPWGAVPRAGAHVAATCWDEWASERVDCHFLLRGVPIEIWGSANGDGEVNVRVRVELYLDVIRFEDPILVFHECEDSGIGEASCEGLLGPDQILNVPFADNLHALCIVEGVGAGEFGCRAGTGT